jgi:transposase
MVRVVILMAPRCGMQPHLGALVMDDSRLMLTDDAWGRIAAVLRQVKHPAGAPPELSDRDFLEAMLYLARTGLPWRDLPGRFGNWDAVYNRFRRWEQAGYWRALFERLPGEALAAVRAVFFDSTVTRAHPHAAGAPRKRGAPGRRAWAAAAAGTRRNSTSPRRTSGRPSPPC